MNSITEKQVKTDMLGSFLLGIISSFLYGSTIISVFTLEYTVPTGKVAMLIISLGFLVAVYLSVKTFTKRLSSLKLLMVDREE